MSIAHLIIIGRAKEQSMQLKKLFLQNLALCITTLAMSVAAFPETVLNAHDIYGKPYHFSIHAGKWIVINYWATWCQFCINEIPELNKLADAIKDRPVVFFGINYDDASNREQQAFALDHGINYLLLQNNPFEKLIPRNLVSTLPTTFVISPDGHVQVLNGELHLSDILDSIR
jgi:thiol-disulfide isomerase/thioredoxin